MTTIKGSTKINNLIVDGNLDINGETNINSTSVKIKDNITFFPFILTSNPYILCIYNSIFSKFYTKKEAL